MNIATPSVHACDIVDAATRREFLVMLGAAGLLAACGDDDAGDGDAASSAQTVEHGLGTSEIPPISEVQAVVVIEGRRDLETALALGLPIVGAPAASPEQPFPSHLEDRLAGVDPLFARGELNLEAVAAATPDLILSRESNAADVYAELSAIAPVLPVQPDGPWRDDLRFAADALQAGVRADELIAEHQDRQAEVAAAHADALTRKIAVVQYEVGGLLFWSSPDGFLLQAQVLDEMGGTFVDAQTASDIREEFSAELIGDFLGDAEGILLITGLDPAADLAELESNGLWTGLPAVQARAVETVPFQLNYGSVLAANACMDRFESLFQKMDDAQI